MCDYNYKIYTKIFTFLCLCNKSLSRLAHFNSSHHNIKNGSLNHNHQGHNPIKKEISQSIWQPQKWQTEHYIVYSGHYGQLSNCRNSFFSLLVAGIALNRTVIIPTFDVKKRLVYAYMNGFVWEKATNIMNLHHSGFVKLISSSSPNPCSSIDMLVEYEGREFYDAFRADVQVKALKKLFVPAYVQTTSYDDQGIFRSNPIRLLGTFEERCLGVSNMYGYIPVWNIRDIMPSTWTTIMKALEPSEPLINITREYLHQTFKNDSFMSLHVRLGDFCSPAIAVSNCGEQAFLRILSAIQLFTKHDAHCFNISIIFLMTNDRNHSLVHNLSSSYTLKFYEHPVTLPVISGVRELDITIIETEIASYGRCFIGNNRSTLTHEVLTRRVVNREFPLHTVGYYK